MGARLRFAGLFAIAAAIPAFGQLEHGHKLGTSVACLEEPTDVRDGTPLSFTLGDSLAQGVIIIRKSNGTPAATVLPPNPVSVKQPCAVFEAWAEQASSDYMESVQTGVAGVDRTEGRAVFHRFVRDDLRMIYVSYTVTMEKLPDEGTYRVSFGPPAGELPAQVRGKADWKAISPAKYPVPQIVKAEDTIRLELYSNGNAMRRVVDYIHAGAQDRMALRKETPHDSYAEDAELTITQPRFRLNGVVAGAIAALPETLRGPVVWVYVPGHGRYVLSLRPRPESGFMSAGEVEGNSLTFTAPDGNVFRIDTAERIAAGSGSYTIHVLPDPGWLPADAQDRDSVRIGTAPGVAEGESR